MSYVRVLEDFVAMCRDGVFTFFTSGSLKQASALDGSRRMMYELETTANETLRIEDSVAGVHGGLILGSITNETLLGREGDVGRGRTVTLYISISNDKQ